MHNFHDYLTSIFLSLSYIRNVKKINELIMSRILLLFCFIMPSLVLSQAVRPAGTMSTTMRNGAQVNMLGVAPGGRLVTEENTKGSPFLNEDFVPGSLYLGEELAVAKIYLKYNAHKDYFLAKIDPLHGDEEAQGVTKTLNMKVKMNNDLYVALPNAENRYDIQYYQVIIEGAQMSLLKKNTKLFKEGYRATTHLTRDVPSTYSDRAIYYLRDTEGNFFEIPKSSKKTYALFKNHSKEVAATAKKYKLNTKNEADLARLVSYYNRL